MVKIKENDKKKTLAMMLVILLYYVCGDIGYGERNWRDTLVVMILVIITTSLSRPWQLKYKMTSKQTKM